MQSVSLRRALLLSLALVLVLAPIAHATTVLKMDLGEMCSRSNLIFRGRVLAIDTGSMQLGDAELPTVTYTLDVSETLLGDAAFFVEKGDQRLARITMVANKAAESVDGDVVRFSKLPEMPDLALNEEYLLMTTRPGATGLSTTVGLGQGCFHISPKTEQAANELGNAGLSAGINGPVSYSQLADEIRALIGQ